MVPSASVMEFTVTAFPVPTFLLLKVDPTVCPKVSDPIKPEKVKVVVAVVVPSYTLLAVEAVAVKVLATIFPVALD